MSRITLLLILLLTASIAKADFRASVVTIDITPTSPKMLLGYSARRSTGIHDRIYHKIVIIDDGLTEFILVSSDLCVLSPSEYDHLAALLHTRLGIDPLHFWWSLTHTHSAPEVGVPGLPEVFMKERYQHEVDTAYTSMVEQKLIEGIITARSRLAPARLGIGWGFSQANINRRAIGPDGKASLGMNPDGPTDHRIGLIRLDRADGTPMALIANYPVHGTVYGPANTEISGDIAGVVSTYVEQKTGVPLLFINGAAGDLAPIYSVVKSPYAKKDTELGQFRVLLGDRILAANKTILLTTDTVKLFAGSMTVETPRKQGLAWPADLDAYTTTTRAGIHMVKLPVRFLKINDDAAIWSAPVELFCQIASAIRDRSPFPYTFFYGYTNGWLGYLPAENEWKYGGYEVENVCPYTASVEKDLSQPVVSYLKGELRKVRRPIAIPAPIVSPAPDGSIALTARNGNGIGPNIRYMQDYRAFGWFAADNRVEWDIDLPNEGAYDVSLEWAVSDKEAGKPYILQTGNRQLTGITGKTGSWETFSTEKIGAIVLKKGLQKITFKPAGHFEKGALLDFRALMMRPILSAEKPSR